MTPPIRLGTGPPTRCPGIMPGGASGMALTNGSPLPIRAPALQSGSSRTPGEEAFSRQLVNYQSRNGGDLSPRAVGPFHHGIRPPPIGYSISPRTRVSLMSACTHQRAGDVTHATVVESLGAKPGRNRKPKTKKQEVTVYTSGCHEKIETVNTYTAVYDTQTHVRRGSRHTPTRHTAHDHRRFARSCHRAPRPRASRPLLHTQPRSRAPPRAPAMAAGTGAPRAVSVILGLRRVRASPCPLEPRPRASRPADVCRWVGPLPPHSPGP